MVSPSGIRLRLRTSRFKDAPIRPMNRLMRVRLRRPTLLVRFSLLSFLLIVALGVTIGSVLHGRIERRALRDATHVADVMTRVGVQSYLERSDLPGPLSERRLDTLDAQLRRGDFPDLQISRVKLYNHHGQVVYSDDRALIGAFHEPSAKLQRALAGESVADVEQGEDDDDSGEPELGSPPAGRKLEVYVPVRLAGKARTPAAVFEVYLPYEPVADAISADSRRLYLLLGIGFALLYGSLFRIVAVASRRLRHQALHDGLTGLANRTLLYERIEDAIAAGRRGDELAAVLLIDLDRFKEVNDTLGHDYGDDLLEEVAARLCSIVRREDTLARLGGDEFAVLLTRMPSRGAVVDFAARVQDALSRPFALRGVVAALDASIGIALCPDHGTDVNLLVQRADVAMYDAKRSGTRIETYAADRDPYSPERLALLGELRDAIAGDELVLHYQPKVALGTDRVIGVEALVRWNHPRHGLLPPVDFVPLAERTGAIGDLTRWVLDTALGQCRAWRDAGIDLPVAVNLAAQNLADGKLPELVEELLIAWELPAGFLECEISEHTVMADPRRAVGVLEGLRALGVRLSLDDFGTGHSSLSYLKRLPLDEVKIDRSFVMGMADDGEDAAIVRSTIDLARNLGLEVVAEGVESAAVLSSLAALSCDVAQGFYLSRPLPAEQIGDWLRARFTPSA
jgi:diguanylate cyclase (GGDEF)-like protein